MEAPVWSWLEGAATPVKAGTLTRDDTTGSGSFLYDPDYVKNRGRPLDPDQLRHISTSQPIPIPVSAREGLPGILADAGPDAWGRKVLAQDLGFEPNAMEALVLSADDGAGNLAVGDLSAKFPLAPIDLEELAEAILRRQEGLPVKDSKVLNLLSPDTALGGAKPKATIFLNEFPWIAKFPERGDPLNLPYYEAAALRMAGRLGICSADVEVRRLPLERSVLLVKRFDRQPGGKRLGVASGLTVMGPQAQALGPFRTYLNFAKRLQPWTRDNTATALTELWERIAFNALMGNIDDHPRNHALLFKNGKWQLSPAFDIVPTYRRTERVSLAMPFLQIAPGKITSLVTARNLVQAASAYGIDGETAHARLIAMTDKILAEWPTVLESLQSPDSIQNETRPLLEWVRHLQTETASLDAEDIKPPPTKSRRRWNWAP